MLTLMTQSSGCQPSQPPQRPQSISNILSVCIFNLSLSVGHLCIQGSLHSNGRGRGGQTPDHPIYPIPCKAKFPAGWVGGWLRGNLLDCILTTPSSLIPLTTVTGSCNHNWVLKRFSSVNNELSTTNSSLSLDTTDPFWKCFPFLDFSDLSHMRLLPLLFLLCSLKLLLSPFSSLSSLLLLCCCPTGFQPCPIVFSLCSSSLIL